MTLMPWLRDRFLTRLGLTAPGGVWRLIAVVLALLNLKTLPGVWHIRLFRALLYHLYLQPTPLPAASLFKPIITSTRSPFLEIDYNGHKSNSTYFSDVDIARTHLVTALLRKGILQANRGEYVSSDPSPGADAVPPGRPPKFLIALGGVACLFKKEIKPYERFEIWTRLLCWDRKWLYIVSHLVKPGTHKPSSYALQPWKNRGSEPIPETGSEEERGERLLKSIYATSIAKYVVKKGRLTIPPEQVLRNSDLLPSKPEGSSGAAESPPAPGSDSPMTETEILGSGFQNFSAGEWTWEFVESHRKRGLMYAEMFAGLDGLHATFDGGRSGSLGQFSDMIFWG